MFTFPWQTRSDIRAEDQLLSGSCDAQELPVGLRPVAELVAALQAPPTVRELGRWDDSLTAFRAAVAAPASPTLQFTRPPRLRGRFSTRLAVASGVAIAALLGGGVAAAYTGSLPGPLQSLAHSAIAAPAAHSKASTEGSAHPAGPSPTGHAASGLCTAYQHAVAHGEAPEHSVAFRNLISAAGGPGKVAAFCARFQHPGSHGKPGKRVVQGGSPGHAGHHGKPPAGEGDNGSGNGSGNGAGGGNGNGSEGNGNGQHGKGNGNGSRPPHS